MLTIKIAFVEYIEMYGYLSISPAWEMNSHFSDPLVYRGMFCT